MKNEHTEGDKILRARTRVGTQQTQTLRNSELVYPTQTVNFGMDFKFI